MKVISKMEVKARKSDGNDYYYIEIGGEWWYKRGSGFILWLPAKLVIKENENYIVEFPIKGYKVSMGQKTFILKKCDGWQVYNVIIIGDDRRSNMIFISPHRVLRYKRERIREARNRVSREEEKMVNIPEVVGYERLLSPAGSLGSLAGALINLPAGGKISLYYSNRIIGKLFYEYYGRRDFEIYQRIATIYADGNIHEMELSKEMYDELYERVKAESTPYEFEFRFPDILRKYAYEKGIIN